MLGDILGVGRPVHHNHVLPVGRGLGQCWVGASILIEPGRKQDSEGTVSAVDAEAASESDSHSGSRLACQALSTAQQRVDESEMAKAEVG